MDQQQVTIGKLGWWAAVKHGFDFVQMEGSEDWELFCEFMFERENDVVSFEFFGSLRTIWFKWFIYSTTGSNSSKLVQSLYGPKGNIGLESQPIESQISWSGPIFKTLLKCHQLSNFPTYQINWSLMQIILKTLVQK